MPKIHLLLAMAVLWQALSYAETMPAPDITEISAAKQAFNDNASRKNYKALFAALETYDDDATVETVEAYIALLRADVQASKYRRLRLTALAAVAHFEPVSDLIPQQYLNAKSLAAIALFNDASRPKAMLEMAHVIGRASQIHNEDWTHPEWAEQIRWRGEAWLYAMGAFFDSHSSGNPYKEQTAEIIASYALEHHENPDTKNDVQYTLPVCDGEMLQKPRLVYPRGAGRKGMYGAVILELEVDETGAISHVRVKASVPFEGFKEQATKTVAKWRYVPTDGAVPGETCEMPRESLIMPVVFLLR